MVKKLIACLLSVCLVAACPGLPFLGSTLARVHAQEPAKAGAQVAAAVDPKAAMDLFDGHGVFTGPDDPMRSYVFDGESGRLSVIGEILYKYYKADPDRAQDFKQNFRQLREAGPMTYKQKEAAVGAMMAVDAEFNDLFKLYDRKVKGEQNAFQMGAMLSAAFDGAARAAQPLADLKQVDTQDGFVFVDGDGEVAIRMTKNMACRHIDWAESAEPVEMSFEEFRDFEAKRKSAGDSKSWTCGEVGGVTVFNRELQNNQKKMNRAPGLPACAPSIPENGRYNYEMLAYTYCLVETDVRRAEQAYRIDLMVRLSQLLGQFYQDDQYLKDDENGNPVLKKLLKLAAEKKLDKYDSVCDKTVETVLELAECKLAKRKEYIDKAAELLKGFQRRVEGYKDRQVITEGDVGELQGDEQHIKKYLMLGYLQTQINQTMGSLEGISFEVIERHGDLVVRAVEDSPDSERLRKAIEEGAYSEHVKKDYMRRAGMLAERLRRLLLVYRRLEDNLLAADHTSPLGRLQAALFSTQKDLGEVGLDVRIFSTIPPVVNLGSKEHEGKVRGGYRNIAWFFNKVSGGSWASGYLENRDVLERSLPVLKGAAASIADGDFDAAREQILTLAPDALRTHWQIGSGAGPGDDPNRMQKVDVVLRQTNAAMGQLMKAHLVADIAKDLAISFVVGAVAAPFIGAAAHGIATACFKFATAAAKLGRAGRAMATMARVVGGIFEHTAHRMHTLGPAADKVRGQTWLQQQAFKALVRGVNTGARVGSFSLGLSGGLSGTLSGLSVVKAKITGDKTVPHASVAAAVKQGYLQGASWGAKHGWILFVGNAASAYEGTVVYPAAQSLANRGVIGNAVGMGQWALGKVGIKTGANLMDRGLQWVTTRGGLVGGVGTAAAMADHIMKYMAVGHGAGWVAQNLSFRFNTLDRDNLERKYKRAESEKRENMERKWWLLMPQFSAKSQGQVEAMQRAREGLKQYEKSGELHRIANGAADITELPLKAPVKKPFMQKFFDLGWLRESGEHGTFKFGKEMKYEAIRKELARTADAERASMMRHLGRGRGPGPAAKGAAPPSRFSLSNLFKFRTFRNPKVAGGKQAPARAGEAGKANQVYEGNAFKAKRYFEVSRKQKGMSGRLHMSDEVRDQAQGLFESTVLKSGKLAQRILGAKPGTTVKGFGRVSIGSQEEVARILIKAHASGTRVSSARLAASQKILKPYIESEKIVADSAKDLLKSLKANKTPSKVFQETVDGFLKKTTTWKNDPGVQKQKTYKNLVQEFRKDAAGQKGMSAQENAVLTSMLDYLEAIDKRFNYFNRAGTASSRADRALSAIRAEYRGGGAPNKTVIQMLDKMMKQVHNWRAAQSSLDAPVGKSYRDMVGTLRKQVEGHEASLTSSDFEVLQTAVKELEAAPWLLRDSKGTNLPGWRPAQFEGLMHFLRSISADGAEASDVIRTFLLMKTGTGKTLLSYEGLLPIAQADSKARKLKTIFLTVQSNLESQARIEFRAMKKLTDLKIDTWEGFKSKIAQSKLEWKGGAEDYWILGDEMDGAALQPALTIGEQTASISKDNAGYRLLKRIGNRMNEILNRGPAEVGKRLDVQIRRQQAALDSLDSRGAHVSKLRESPQGLIKLSKNLTQLKQRSFKPSSGKMDALRRAEGMIRNLSTGKAAPSNAATVKKLKSLVGELKKADGAGAQQAVSRVDAQLREAWTRGHAQSIKRVTGRIRTIVDAQMKTLDASGSLFSKADKAVLKQFREAGGKIKQTARQHNAVGKGDLDLSVQQIRDMMREQSSILNQTAPANRGAARSLKRMARTARRSGNVIEAKKLEAQARQVLSGSKQARAGLDANSRDILKTLKEGKPGWQGRVRELAQQREGLVERAVVKKNPIYEIFRNMRQDMYSLVRSQTRVTDTREVLDAAPAKAGETLKQAGRGLTKDLVSLVRRYREIVKSGKGGPQARKMLQRAESLLKEGRTQRKAWHSKSQDLSRLLDKPRTAKQQALYDARDRATMDLAKAESDLSAVRADLKKADAASRQAVQQRLRQAEQTVQQSSTKLKDVHRSLREFEKPQAQLIQSALRDMQADAGRLSKSWKQKLAGFDGPEADVLRSRMGSLERSWQSQTQRLDWTPERAVEVLHRRISGVGTAELATRYALKYTGARALLSKVPGLKGSRWAKPLTPHDVGLTRTYARQLLKNFMNDPFIPPEVRWKMLWSIGPSALWPRGVTGKGSSWVMTELFNLARGYTDNPANIRIDNITGRINVIHNGQWFESMDTPTRRYWELEYNSDLTLPYEHKTIVTMNDFVKDNLNVRIVGFSGTSGPEHTSYIKRGGFRVAGVGSLSAKDVPIEIHQSATGKFKSISNALRDARVHDAARVKAGKQADSLVVLSLPDTQMVKAVRRYLIKTGMIKPGEIASVFSDAELLRLNRPQAQVGKQMNLGALTQGKIKLLILDTRVGGRGLDLNFKGPRNAGPEAFQGYNEFMMLLVDPQQASGAHFIQAQGRIDTGRIPKGAVRRFKMVMDLQGAAKDPVFRRMLSEEPLFHQLRQHPDVVRVAMKNGRFTANWSDIHSTVMDFKGKGKQGHITDRYQKVVEKYLVEKQLTVEKDQLRSASVLQDAATFDPAMRGLNPVSVPGR
ncbi:MAG: hypothetical protein ABII00_05210 [Elusimicrobiota bacterium]